MTLFPAYAAGAGASLSRRYDAAVIGGGVVGCAVLRALTLNGLRVVLLERAADILDGASKGNSAILHTGFDAPPGSLEVKLMQAGRKAYLACHDALGLPILETGAVLVAWNEDEAAKLASIVSKAHKNGVNDVQAISKAELARLHPHLSQSAVAALVVPGEHIIDPWSAPLAYALQALMNGAAIIRQAEVTAARHDASGWVLSTSRGEISARTVINCAGNFGDHVNALAGKHDFKIRPRKGQFVVFDKAAMPFMPSIVLPVPTERTKGVVLCPTIFGNVLVGPTAEDQDERSIATVERGTLHNLIGEASRMVPALGGMPITATYAGLRPASERSDYIIEADPQKDWITIGGIRSTGLTAALGIADYVCSLVEEHFCALKPLGNPLFVQVPNLAEHLPRDHEKPGRGDIVCLCETVTRREIEAALNGPLPAGNLGGLKRRTRAMLGRCQGFNCLAAVCDMAKGRLLEPPPLPGEALVKAAHAS